WFKMAFTYLNSDIGPQYSELLHRWVELSRSHNWTYSRRSLPARGRPPELSKWLHEYLNKRIGARIDAKSLPAFAESVWKWWTLMQPAWRTLDESGRPTPLVSDSLDGSLKSLDISGPRGWFGLIVCLKWWGSILRHHVSDQEVGLQEEWLEAIEDISGTLGCLIEWKRRQT
ncbi:hypothetical protein K435DRAFT_666670, partial [Dendrothele bispora CBS 962.96]